MSGLCIKEISLLQLIGLYCKVIGMCTGVVGTWNIWERGEVYTGFWWGKLKERVHLEYPGIDEKIILRLIFQEVGCGAPTGSIWIRLGRGGGHL
jgi:hypothetical protein